MTASLLKACLAALGWSHDDLARHLRCSGEAVQGWGETRPVPPEIDEWLHGLAGMVTGSHGVEEWVAWRASLPTVYPPPEDVWPVDSAIREPSARRSTCF